MLVWTINLSFRAPKSSSECWQRDSELGLGGDNSVTAAMGQLTRVRPAFDPAQGSLLGWIFLDSAQRAQQSSDKAGLEPGHAAQGVTHLLSIS